MMKFNLFVLVGALAVATATAGKSIICADDPNYVSSLGLSCEHHIQVDCHAFAHVGMPLQEVDELLQRCPNSCRVDGCSSNERTGSLRISDKGALAMASRSLEGKIDRGANIAADSADVLSRSLEGDTCFGGKCKDDPLFRSKFFLPCESHVSFDCGILQAVGFSASEVTDLIRSCPCSCKQECPGPSTVDTSSAVSPAPTPSPTKAPTTSRPTSQPSRSPATKTPTSSPTGRPTSPVTKQPPQSNDGATDSIEVEELDSDEPQHPGEVWDQPLDTPQHPGEVWDQPQHPGEVVENEAINYYDPIGDQTHFDIIETGQDSPSQIVAAKTYEDAGDNESSSWARENAMYIAFAIVGAVGLVATFRFVRHRARKRFERQLINKLAVEYRNDAVAGARGAQPNDNLGGGFDEECGAERTRSPSRGRTRSPSRGQARSQSRGRRTRSPSRSRGLSKSRSRPRQ